MRATVSTSGLVTGVSVGSTRVTATIEGVEGGTDLEVTEVTPPVASVTVEPGELKVAPGRLGRLVAILSDNFGTPFTGPAVTWSSADPGIATVDARGVVAAVARGTTTITATAEGLSATSTVSVDPIFEIVSLAVSPTSADVAVRDSAQFGVIAKNAQGETLAGRLVEWSMVTPGFATVSEDGLVVGVSQGQTAVRAAADGFTAEARVTVLPPLISSSEVLPGNRRWTASSTASSFIRQRWGPNRESGS